MAHMGPEMAVEFDEARLLVRVAEREDLSQQVGVAADRALAENDQAAGQDVGALHRDADRNSAVEVADVVVRAVDDGLARMDVHGVVERDAHALGRVQFHDARDHRRMMALIEAGAGQPPRAVENVGNACKAGELFLHALEFSDRHMELLRMRA